MVIRKESLRVAKTSPSSNRITSWKIDGTFVHSTKKLTLKMYPHTKNQSSPLFFLMFGPPLLLFGRVFIGIRMNRPAFSKAPNPQLDTESETWDSHQFQVHVLRSIFLAVSHASEKKNSGKNGAHQKTVGYSRTFQVCKRCENRKTHQKARYHGGRKLRPESCPKSSRPMDANGTNSPFVTSHWAHNIIKEVSNIQYIFGLMWKMIQCD